MMQANENKSNIVNVGQVIPLLPQHLMLKPIAAAMMAICLGLTVNIAHAGERESLEQLRSTTVNLVNLLVQEGVLSKAKAEDLLRQATQDAAKAREKDALAEAEKVQSNPQDAGVEKAIDEKMVRVQYVPDIVKKEIKDEIKKEVMTKLNYKAGERLGVPDWIDRLQWEGDVRLRYQADRFAEGNPIPSDFNVANWTDLNNTKEDQDRARIRARLGVKAKVNDWMTAGISLTTGNQNDPISPNQTQGTNSAKYNFGLDRAYLKAEIKPWLNVVGGRFANPWFSTDLVWDPDLAFDGVATSLTPKITDNWSSFLTVGAFPLDQTEMNGMDQRAKSKWMFGSQLGIKWTSPDLSTAKLGVAFYGFQHGAALPNPRRGDNFYNGTAPAYRTKGNSYFDLNYNNQDTEDAVYGLTSKFREVNITGQIDIATFNPVHIILTGDYVRNIGFDSQEITNRTGLPLSIVTGGIGKQVDGYQVKLAVGMPNTFKQNDWQVFAGYKYLEADAVMDAYTDSDFHLGGTNAKGWLIGASYGVDKNAWLTARWYSADEINPRLQRNVAISPLGIDVLMLDLNARF